MSLWTFVEHSVLLQGRPFWILSGSKSKGLKKKNLLSFTARIWSFSRRPLCYRVPKKKFGFVFLPKDYQWIWIFFSSFHCTNKAYQRLSECTYIHPIHSIDVKKFVLVHGTACDRILLARTQMMIFGIVVSPARHHRNCQNTAGHTQQGNGPFHSKESLHVFIGGKFLSYKSIMLESFGFYFC